MPSKWMKNNTEDIIWWLDNEADTRGEWVFSFDKKRRFNMFADYPWKLTSEQKEVLGQGESLPEGLFFQPAIAATNRLSGTRFGEFSHAPGTA